VGGRGERYGVTLALCKIRFVYGAPTRLNTWFVALGLLLCW
jgi:hypothetical protein